MEEEEEKEEEVEEEEEEEEEARSVSEGKYEKESQGLRTGMKDVEDEVTR